MKPTAWAGLDRAQAVERLTALWALNEAGLGGLIHALRVPFTGVVVGSTAVVLITLIVFFAEHKARALIKAMTVVLLVKAAASPHTPLPAYISVAFQGVAAALVFGVLPSIRLGALLLGLLALWQGAVQKLIVMSVLYGRSLWESVDAVGHWILNKMGQGGGDLSPTGWFVFFYLGYYTVAGLITGWLAGVVPREITELLKQPPPEKPMDLPPTPLPLTSRKRWWRRTPFRAGLLLLILLAVLVWASPGDTGWHRGLKVFLRASVVLLVWMGLVRPLGAALFRRFRQHEQTRYGADAARIMEQFPVLKQNAAVAWQASKGAKGFRRWQRFLVEWIVRGLA
ncbi:MAG TPA: hypothetical protein PLD40_10165 [Kiritimatiellia bacterium]|nr:hypothetical protein [Kiritimatiellia bacterium]